VISATRFPNEPILLETKINNMAFKMKGGAFLWGKKDKNKKKNPFEPISDVNYDLPYEGSTGKSKNRQVADRMYDSRVTPEERQLGSELSQDSEGNWIRRTALSSPALLKTRKRK
jgi:hypothetical protein